MEIKNHIYTLHLPTRIENILIKLGIEEISILQKRLEMYEQVESEAGKRAYLAGMSEASVVLIKKALEERANNPL